MKKIIMYGLMLLVLSFSAAAIDTNYTTYGLNNINGFFSVDPLTYGFTGDFTLTHRLNKYSEYSPLVADLDMDGTQEIIIISRADETIYIYGSDGIIKNQLDIHKNITGNPGVFELHDAGLEIIFPWVNDSTNGMSSYHYNGSLVFEANTPPFSIPTYDYKHALASEVVNASIFSYVSTAAVPKMSIHYWNGTGLGLVVDVATGLSPSSSTATYPLISRLNEDVSANKGGGTDINADGKEDFCAVHFPSDIVCADIDGVVWGNFSTAPHIDNINGFTIINPDGGDWEFIVTGIDQIGVEATPRIALFNNGGSLVRFYDTEVCGLGLSTCNVAASTAPLVFIPSTLATTIICFGWVSNDDGLGDNTADMGLTCLDYDLSNVENEITDSGSYLLPQYNTISSNLIGFMSFVTGTSSTEPLIAFPNFGIFDLFNDDLNDSRGIIAGINVLRADIDNDEIMELISTNGTETLIYTLEYTNEPPEIISFNWSTGNPVCLGSTQTYTLNEWFDAEQNIIKLNVLCDDGTNDTTGFIAYDTVLPSVSCLKNATGGWSDFIYLEDFTHEGAFENVSYTGFTQTSGNCFSSGEGGGNSDESDYTDSDPDEYECWGGFCWRDENGEGSYEPIHDEFTGEEDTYFQWERCEESGLKRNAWCPIQLIFIDFGVLLLFVIIGGGSLYFLGYFILGLIIKFFDHGKGGGG